MACRALTCLRKCIFYLLVPLLSIKVLSETKKKPNSISRLPNEPQDINVCTLLPIFMILSKAAVYSVFSSEARVRDSHALPHLPNMQKTKPSE